MRVLKWFGKGLCELWKTLITRTYLFLGNLFTWVMPIYLLADQVALTQETSTRWKLSFAGILVVVFVAVKWYGKIKDKINAIEPKTRKMLTFQFLLIIIQKVITLGGIAFLIVMLQDFIVKINEWYMLSLVPMGIGLVCFLIDRYIMFKKRKADAVAKIEALKEQIKGEIANGQ